VKNCIVFIVFILFVGCHSSSQNSILGTLNEKYSDGIEVREYEESIIVISGKRLLERYIFNKQDELKNYLFFNYHCCKNESIFAIHYKNNTPTRVEGISYYIESSLAEQDTVRTDTTEFKLYGANPLNLESKFYIYSYSDKSNQYELNGQVEGRIYGTIIIYEHGDEGGLQKVKFVHELIDNQQNIIHRDSMMSEYYFIPPES